MKNSYYNMHKKANYLATIETIPHIRGIKLTIPKNIFVGLPERTLIYEIEDNTINVYCFGEKVETFSVPTYAARNYIVSDIYCKLTDVGMNLSLLKFIKNGKELKNGSKVMIRSLIPKSDNELVNKEEDILEDLLANPSKSEELLNSPVFDGFKLIFTKLERLFQ